MNEHEFYSNKLKPSITESDDTINTTTTLIIQRETLVLNKERDAE